MHAHGVAHLDISLRNILTNFEGHYAYIDFETSRLYPYWNDDRSREVSRYDDKGTTKSKRENHLGENMPYSNSAQNDSQRSLYPQLRLRSHIYSSSSSSQGHLSNSRALSLCLHCAHPTVSIAVQASVNSTSPNYSPPIRPLPPLAPPVQ